MGAINFSLDIELVRKLQSILNITVFIETGTFEGDTVNECHPFLMKLYQ